MNCIWFMSLLNIEDAIIPKEETSETAVGIDFGTTNSLCFHWDGENMQTIVDIMPSLLYYDDLSNITESKNAKHSISSIKKYLAQDKQIIIGEKKFWAEQIASEIFKKIKKEINNQLGDDVIKCVVTVPAYFDDAKRQSVKFAAELAGLNVIRMINEPTSAALYYNVDDKEEGGYIVFDLGGGTFDVSILNMQKGVVHVIATGGDINLGGDNFDNAIANHYNVSKNLGKAIKEISSNKTVTKELLRNFAQEETLVDHAVNSSSLNNITNNKNINDKVNNSSIPKCDNLDAKNINTLKNDKINNNHNEDRNVYIHNTDNNLNTENDQKIINRSYNKNNIAYDNTQKMY